MTNPVVGVVMGSDSDWNVMSEAAAALKDFGLEFEVEVLSAHPVSYTHLTLPTICSV